MLDSESKYDYVKEILVGRMSKYRRNSFKLERLYDIIHSKTEEEAYVDFTYQEFYDMFKKECINGNIPLRKFEIAEEGFLDKKKKFPYAVIHVEVLSKKKVG